MTDVFSGISCCLFAVSVDILEELYACCNRKKCFQQVLSAKVVTNARSPGSKCYGLVTMSSSTEVTRCISHLDCTELHGQQIYVERVSKRTRPRRIKNLQLVRDFLCFMFVFFLLRQKMIHLRRSPQKKKQRTNQMINAVPQGQKLLTSKCLGGKMLKSFVH